MKYQWHETQITTAAQAAEMVQQFKESAPRLGALDTETTGLHIILDKPFVFQWGFADDLTLQGYAYCVDMETHPILSRQCIKAWLKLAEELEVLGGANLKFDFHMLLNIGFTYSKENVKDLQFLIRYGHDAIAEKNGGAPLALKDYATRYIDRNATFYERALKSEQSAIAKAYNQQLKSMMVGMLKKDIDKFFKDNMNDPEDFPPQAYQQYLQWHAALPEWLRDRFTNVLEAEHIPYNKLNRATLLKYATKDIVLTIEGIAQLEPVVEIRQNQYAIQVECDLIYPLLEMERTGFKTDIEYLQESRVAMKNYIKERRNILYGLAGKQITIGQHAVIKDLLNTKFGIPCTTTNAEELSRIKSDTLRGVGSTPGTEFISIIQELRTFEKWYSTYILRFLRNLHQTDRLYTTINQVGAVSGRVTSDFQQFPKEGIETADGREIFNPRRMVSVPGGDFNALVYLDYSQIELRLQAMYTILVGHPDLNLCRAFMPYLCHTSEGLNFDFNNPEHIRQFKNNTWYLNEETGDVLWEAVDVHGAMTVIAFKITKDDPMFHKLRSKGKRVNFAKNYGAQEHRISQMFPEYDEEQVKEINDAYYKAFPGIKFYQEYCHALMRNQTYATNLFGVRYYNVSGHNLINMMIQGSAATFLKIMIRRIWEYSKAHNVKSRFQMNIHDELSWERYSSESDVFYRFKEIMEDWPDTLVPIIAEMEISYSTWADKTGEIEWKINT